MGPVVARLGGLGVVLRPQALVGGLLPVGSVAKVSAVGDVVGSAGPYLGHSPRNRKDKVWSRPFLLEQPDKVSTYK